jgi:8-oxo-dGTP pyrophosphatase MutT (NUDIX family)
MLKKLQGAIFRASSSRRPCLPLTIPIVKTKMASDPPPRPTLSFAFSSSVTPFNVHVKTYLASHEECEAIATGALVFDGQDRLLVLQRAANDSMPHLWEIPGGACDEEDETILHGVTREVWEESGLKVSAFRRRVGPDNGHVFFTRKGLKVCKYSFETEVESTEGVRLDPKEHQNYIWVTEEECRSHKVEDGNSVLEIKFTTPAQEATILEGFRLRKAAKIAKPDGQ